VVTTYVWYMVGYIGVHVQEYLRKPQPLSHLSHLSHSIRLRHFWLQPHQLFTRRCSPQSLTQACLSLDELFAASFFSHFTRVDSQVSLLLQVELLGSHLLPPSPPSASPTAKCKGMTAQMSKAICIKFFSGFQVVKKNIGTYQNWNLFHWYSY